MKNNRSIFVGLRSVNKTLNFGHVLLQFDKLRQKNVREGVQPMKWSLWGALTGFEMGSLRGLIRQYILYWALQIASG